MKRLTTYLNERLIVNKNYKQYTYAPASCDELREIIKYKYDKLGPGTEKNPIDFNDVDVSKIDSFWDGNKGIFEETKFEYIDISNWNVSNIKRMDSMFFKCEKLESPGDLSRWNVSNIEYMCFMFYNCKSLKSVGYLSNWNVSNVESMDYMFNVCEKLESVGDLSKWNVSKVKGMYNMFYGCKQLKSVGDLSNWNISKAKNMSNMFYGSGITNIPYWYKE